MVMNAMRDSAKWVMLFLVLAFVGWLVFDWVQSRGTGGQITSLDPVVGRIEGREVHYSQWNQYLQQQLAAQRESQGGLTEEQVRLVRENAWENLVSEILMQVQIDRLGITVTDEEVRQAFLSRPPPEFQSQSAFQTDGQFDIEKYRNFVASPGTPETMLLQLEAYYRRILPREKLANLVVEGVYVSDAEAWELYQDANETVQASFVTFDPNTLIADSLVTVSDASIDRYYGEHREDFERPATATVNLLNLPVRATSADTTLAVEKAQTLRDQIAAGSLEFEEAARTMSADSATGLQGGDLGKRTRGDLDAAFEEAAFSAVVGEVTGPVETGFGFHLLRVDSRDADTVSVRHILIPIEISDVTEDSIFDLIDEIEDIALDDGLVVAAERLGLTLSRGITLSEGSTFVPGAGALGVAPEWALDPQTEMGELSPFFESAAGHHVAELLDRSDAGTFRVEEVADQVRQTLLQEEKKALARDIARQAADAIAGGMPLQEAAVTYGGSHHEAQTFRRVDAVPGLGQGSEAVGEAFGIAVGQTSGAAEAGGAWAIVSVHDRTQVTSEEYLAEREALRQQLTFQRRSEYVNRWFTELRETADVQDFRADVLTEQS